MGVVVCVTRSPAELAREVRPWLFRDGMPIEDAVAALAELEAQAEASWALAECVRSLANAAAAPSPADRGLPFTAETRSDALAARLEAAETALEWYANQNRYRVGAWPQDDGTDGAILPDQGERARAALAAGRGERG